MNHELTCNTSFYEHTTSTMFTGKVRIVLDNQDAPLAEVHVWDEQTGETTTLVYADPAQIEVLSRIIGAIEGTHMSFEMPRAV